MEKVIAVCVSVALTLSLIGYALVTGNKGHEGISQKVSQSSGTINARINDRDLVSKYEVERYLKNADSLNYWFLYNSSSFEYIILPNAESSYRTYYIKNIREELKSMSDIVLFRVKKTIGEDGKVSVVECSLVEK